MKIFHTTLAVALPLAAILLAVTFGGLPKIPVQTQTCTISTSGQCSVTFTLGSGDQVSGSASIKGGQETSLWVTDDSGANVYNGGKVGGVANFLFSAGAGGAYAVHFSNLVSSLTTKLVTVNYNIAARADC